MLRRKLGWIAALLAAALPMATAGAASRCTLAMFPPLPIKMENLRPVITAAINGVDARFIVDTGSFFDFLSPAAAAQFQLPLSYAPPWYRVSGIGGSVSPRIATAKAFTVAGVTVHDAQFLVGDNDFQGEEVGLLGQNLFRIDDVEYDFADGMLRFVKPQHCRGTALTYWTTTQPYGAVALHWTSTEQPDLIGKATVNGHDIDVLFDTGSPRTILSLAAAKRAGITPDSPGVTPAGVTSGLGKDTIKVWVAPVARFEIGGEAIEHTHLLIGDIDLDGLDADMLLGSDFFLAHHIYVAYSQNKLYFTYNGGPVFDLNARRPAQTAAAQGKATPAASPPAPVPVPNTPADAADFMRRGMADLSRGEFTQAVTDLTHACDLDASDADCRYQRGLAYWHSSQRDPALADFNAAIQLRPDDFDAHLARADLELRQRPSSAESDLDAVDHFAPQQADLRLRLAILYATAGEYAGAIHQYDLWIEYHPNDIRLPYALRGRCESEAAANVDVDRAVDDCGTALRLMPKTAPVRTAAILMSNRGLAYFREGRLDSALADLDAALKLQPQFPAARYERGLVELKKGLATQGRADLAAAQAQDPGVAKRLAGVGLTP